MVEAKSHHKYFVLIFFSLEMTAINHISNETVYGKLKQTSANKLDWLTPKCSLWQSHVHTGLRNPKQTCQNITQQVDNPRLSQYID